MMKKRHVTKCRVKWEPDRRRVGEKGPLGVSAVLYASDGRSINVAYYRKRPTTAERKRMEKKLQRGCAELSRPGPDTWGRGRGPAI